MHTAPGTSRSGDENREGKTAGVTNNNSDLFGYCYEARLRFVKVPDRKISDISIISPVRKVPKPQRQWGLEMDRPGKGGLKS
jgi:hypothetical protein